MVNIEDALNRFINNAKSARRVDDRMYQLNKRVGGSPFTAGYSTSVLRWGGSNLPPELGQAPKFSSRESMLGMSSLVRDPEGFGGGIFRVKTRRSPSYGRTGFGHLVVGREKFMEVMDTVGDDPRRQQEAIETLLTYTDASLQLERVGKQGGQSFVDTTRSRNITAPDYIRQQATNIRKMVSGDITSDQMRNAFVFDIETAGLDASAGIRQIAYTDVQTGQAREILFDNPMMDMGVYELPDGSMGSFKEYLAAQKGTTVDGLNFKSRVEGLREFFQAVDNNNVEILMGQNVSFDIEHILAEGESVAELADKEFKELFQRARRKMLGDGPANIVDTRHMMSLLLDHDVDPTGIGKGRAFSQEAVSGFTSLLQDAKRQGLLSEDTWNALAKTGLHDAAVDIDVTRAIGVLQHAILSREKGAEQLMRSIKPETLDKGIRESLEGAGAVLPTTAMPGTQGEVTPLTTLIRGSRRFTSSTGEVDFFGLLYEGSKYNYRRLAGPTRDALAENARATRGRSVGFLNPDFTREIAGRSTESYLGGEVSPALPGTTVQERLIRMNAPFANALEPERMIGELLNQSSIGHQSSRFAADFGINYFRAFRAKDAGRVFTNQFANVAIDPRILKAADSLSDGGLLNAVRTKQGGLVTRLSPVKRNNHVAVLLDLFQDGQEQAVKNFLDNIRGVVQGIDNDDADVLRALKKAGYTDDEIRQIGSAMDSEAFEELAARLRDPSVRRYGIQVGIYENTPEAAQWLKGLTPEREEARKANRMFGQYLTDLPTGNQGIASLPVQGIEELQYAARHAGMIGPVQSTYTPHEAVETLGEIHREAARARREEVKLTEHLSTWWNRQVAEGARDVQGFGSRAHRLTSMMQGLLNKASATFKVPRNRWMLGAAVIAGVTGATLMGEEESYEKTLVQGAYGYEGSGEYRDYKASLGETPAADFATNPVIRRPPTIDTMGIVQDAHDNRTGHHNMDRTTKYAHLFGY